MPENKIICGAMPDATKVFPDGYFNCSISSPPYWALRDYGVDGQLGLEPTFEEYIDKLCTIYDEVFRVLRPDGTCFVNLADTFSSGLTSSLNFSILRQDITIKEKKYVGLELSREVQKMWQTNGNEACQRFVYAMLPKNVPENQEVQRKSENISAEVLSCTQRKTKSTSNKTKCVTEIRDNKETGGQVYMLRGKTERISDPRPYQGQGKTRVYSEGCIDDIQTGQKRGIPKNKIPHSLLELQRLFRNVRLLSTLKFNKSNLPQQLKSYFVDKEITEGIPAKSLCLIPQRFAIEMVNRGWILRNVIIWHKPNPMPSSAKDRFTVDFEYVYFFVKSKKYWFEPQYEPYLTESNAERPRMGQGGQTKYNQKRGDKIPKQDQLGKATYTGFNARYKRPALGRNKRTVWTIPTQSFPDAHFATFPEKLVEPMIKAGCPEFVCNKCGKAREKIYERGDIVPDAKGYKPRGRKGDNELVNRWNTGEEKLGPNMHYENIFKGYTDCGCKGRKEYRSGVVLDCFCWKLYHRQGRRKAA